MIIANKHPILLYWNIKQNPSEILWKKGDVATATRLSHVLVVMVMDGFGQKMVMIHNPVPRVVDLDLIPNINAPVLVDVEEPEVKGILR